MNAEVAVLFKTVPVRLAEASRIVDRLSSARRQTASRRHRSVPDPVDARNESGRCRLAPVGVAFGSILRARVSGLDTRQRPNLAASNRRFASREWPDERRIDCSAE
jgi:hypothetical protein